ncbi:WUSCHEL-related homeobox 11 [Daucus carota subsp. sativus]|uniref:WUSCHEL-related homeobox 11 n=1 Tax=Daucus carota subsp. sativus TaxID=79200 RepID=UPI0007B25389|nr:PREDICTED: WUSCHEL-related homeobox 11 [Daucus carota subsp. sativus]
MEYRNDQIHQGREGNGEAVSVRPRWTPKQEQLVMLESIYSSGVVNPPKDETTRIRKLLEEYGPVVDSNVFYWFQNRRSRSRRRTRQIQAKINREQAASHESSGSTNAYEHQNSTSFTVPNSGEQDFFSPVSSSCLGGGHFLSSSDPSLYGDNSSFYPTQVCYPGNERNSSDSTFHNTFSAETSNVHYQSGGLITVFINGVATDVSMGPLDMKGMFGEQDLLLFHSSGVQVSNTCFSSSLQHGESYFLVPGANQ